MQVAELDTGRVVQSDGGGAKLTHGNAAPMLRHGVRHTLIEVAWADIVLETPIPAKCEASDAEMTKFSLESGSFGFLDDEGEDVYDRE